MLRLCFRSNLKTAGNRLHLTSFQRTPLLTRARPRQPTIYQNHNLFSTNTRLANESTVNSDHSDTEMAPIPPIFTLKVPAYTSPSHKAPEGTFTLTQPAKSVYLLSFNSPPDNRLTPPFLDTFCLALDIIQTKLRPGVVITTSSIPKFYSNGLDYGAAIANENFMPDHLFPLWKKLLTFPWPTIAVMNGHAFAGGLMTAMAHDYRIHNPHKGYICLNELDFNAPLSPPMATLFRVKLSMATFRTLILETKRFNALSALEAGIIDSVGDVDTAIKFIDEFDLVKKCRPVPGGVGSGSGHGVLKIGKVGHEAAYGLIKREMYREIIADLDVSGPDGRAKVKVDVEGRQKEAQKMKEAVESWVKDGGKVEGMEKAKL